MTNYGLVEVFETIKSPLNIFQNHSGRYGNPKRKKKNCHPSSHTRQAIGIIRMYGDARLTPNTGRRWH